MYIFIFQAFPERLLWTRHSVSALELQRWSSQSNERSINPVRKALGLGGTWRTFWPTYYWVGGSSVQKEASIILSWYRLLEDQQSQAGVECLPVPREEQEKREHHPCPAVPTPAAKPRAPVISTGPTCTQQSHITQWIHQWIIIIAKLHIIKLCKLYI